MLFRPLTPASGRRASRFAAILAMVMVAGPLTAAASKTGSKAKPASRSKRSSSATSRKEKIRQLRARLKTVTARKADQRQELRATKRAEGRLSDKLNSSYQRLEDANTSLVRSGQRLKAAERELQVADRELAAAEARLKQQQQRFGKRIAFYYRQGSVEYLDVLVGAANLSDFLDRKYYIERIMAQDAVILTALRDAQHEVEVRRKQVLARREQLAFAHQENQQLVTQVAERTQEMEGLMRVLRQERSAQEQRLLELEEDSGGIQRQLEQELARRLANPRAYRHLPAWTGNFGRPVNGPITSGFGYRFHPVLRYQRLHTGIDFGAATGSPVFAAADGEVFHASWRGGYGRCIILLHGGNISTLYAHLSSIQVTNGQSVKRGQVIGAVGSTGLSTGPHLHFEVRRNGVPVNPR